MVRDPIERGTLPWWSYARFGVRGLLDHPHRERWQPGGGGMCLHTIVRDPGNADRMWIAVSSAGVYRTTDGGRTWIARNTGIRAEFMPEKYPEFGQCVHKVVQAGRQPDRLYLQNHGGLYRSDDGGDSWQDIANGVPSDFGFPMVAHPHDSEVAYIVPLELTSSRRARGPAARLPHARRRQVMEPLSKGLPQKDAYETVLRDGLAVDTSIRGVYFGTRSGKLYGSSDGGASWTLMADGLPPIVCVKTAVIGSPKLPKKKKPATKKAAPRSRRPSRIAKAATKRARGSKTR